MEQNRSEVNSGLVISEDVIAKIASTAALDVSGVDSIIPKPADIRKLIKREKSSKAVSVFSNDTQTILDIYIKVKSGIRITDVAEQVQERIKDAVQNMTGRVVTKVNVHIADINLKRDTASE